MRKGKAKENKEKLLQMARNGEPKPTRSTSPLGQALINYTKKGGPGYDPEFDRLIRELAPQWFDYSEGFVSRRTRELLIRDAKNGAPKPKATVCGDYLHKNGRYYHEPTVEFIKTIAPHWFVVRGCKILEKKKEILQLLQNGLLNYSHPLYRAYYNYTCTTSNSYDPLFVEETKKIISKTAQRNKITQPFLDLRVPANQEKAKTAFTDLMSESLRRTRKPKKK